MEVLFSIAFLILVGFAVIALNVATLRLVTDSETKSIAYALDDEANAYLSVSLASLNHADATNFFSQASCTASVCYLVCDTAISPKSNCNLKSQPASVQLGRSRLRFSRQIKATETPAPAKPGHYLIATTVSWGTGSNRQISTKYFLQGANQ
jgi:hypothetical protein